MNKSLLIALLLLPVVSSAQTSQPAPQPPALRPPANPSAWTVQYKSEADKKPKQTADAEDGAAIESAETAPATPKIKKVEFVINGKIGRSIATYSDGTTRTAFVFGSLGVEENPSDPKDLVINDFSSPQMVGGDFMRRYPGLEWVKPKFYRGVVEFGDTQCHHFAEEVPAQSSPSSREGEMTILPSEMLVGNREAWIAKNGRPLATRQGTETASYTYLPTNEVPVINIPDRFRAKATAFVNSLAPTNLK